MIRYVQAPDIEEQMLKIIEKLRFRHVRLDSVKCMRSYGSSSRNTIARCHGLGKIMQKCLGREGFYVLEFLSETFDKLDEAEKTKTIIHELMHIPRSFGGGFRHHDFVSRRNVEILYREFLR